MYSILFHVSGIAILEICFFFYYIGPMETLHFKSVVNRLLNEPFWDVQNSINQLQYYTNSQSDTIKSNLLPINFPTVLPINVPNNRTAANEYLSNYVNSYLNESNNMNETELHKMNSYALIRREEKNQQLFIKTIEIWGAFAFINCLIYLLCCKYKEIVRSKDVRNSIVNVRSYDVELTEHVRYRKNSEQLDNLDETNKCKCNDTFLKICYYCLFAGCIITFQYFFFEYIVLLYDPLSLDEVKYLMYLKLLSIINNQN